jgi:hypothetical protein
MLRHRIAFLLLQLQNGNCADWLLFSAARITQFSKLVIELLKLPNNLH